MPGTLVHDGNQATLLDGTLTTNTTGTIRDFGRPLDVQLRLTVGTVSGTSPTMDVKVEASDSSTFASGVVVVGNFTRVTASDKTLVIQGFVAKRYLRATATITGTTPSFGSTKLQVEEPHYRRNVDVTG